MRQKFDSVEAVVADLRKGKMVIVVDDASTDGSGDLVSRLGVRWLQLTQHIGLGGDYDGNDAWPDGLEDVSGYPRLFAELIRRGWSDADLARLASGNILRVMKRAEEVSARLQRERPASVATYESLDGGV